MSFDNTWLFVQVVLHGGISAAAKANQLQRSKVSRRLQELEDSLGCELLIRTTRTIELTEHGKHLYAVASERLQSVASGLAQIRAHKQDFDGKIRLAIPSALMTSTVFNSVLTDYSCAFPNVKIEIENHQQSVNLKRQNFDLQILPNVVHVSDDQYVQFRLLPYKCCFVASQQYVKAHNKIQSFDDLKEHRLFVNRYHSAIIDKSMDVSLKSDDLYLLRSMAKSGLGIAFLPELHVTEAIDKGELIEVLSGYEHKELQLTMLYPSNSYLPNKVKVLIDMFRTEFGNS
ncbi:LysR family transcriptional regulator [Vibrio sp. E150_011]